MPTRTILFALVCLIALTSSVVALRQHLLVQQLRQSLAECQSSSTAMQERVARLEENLQSAGQQMSNLSVVIQEATRRANRCEAERSN